MANKFTVDLVNKIIAANLGEHEIDVQVDLYSDLKEDWKANLNGEAKFAFPFRTVGGDTISSTLRVGQYFFIRNDLGWRIRPCEEHATITLLGNLYPEDPDQPVFIPTVGAFTVSVFQERSSLTLLATPRTAFKQGQDFPNFQFVMNSSTTHQPQAGLSVSGERYANGGWAALENVVSDIGNGTYMVTLSGSQDLVANMVTLRFTAAGADTRIITLAAAA